MKKFFIKLNLLFSLLILFFCAPFVYGEEIDFNKDLTENLKKDLQIKLTELQEQIDKYQREIEAQKKQEQSLKNEIDIANKQIKAVNLEIQEINYRIQQLQILINQKNVEIADTEKKLDISLGSIRMLLNKLWQYDNISDIEILLANSNLSNFFINLRALTDLQKKIKFSVDEIKTLKSKLLAAKEGLNDDLSEQEDLKIIQEEQKKNLIALKKNLNNLILKTQGKEKEYQEMLKKTNKTAAEIQRQIFTLEGAGLQMTFGEAFNYARFAASKTGVREALILAVLKYESKWGKNIGAGNWQKDMAPSQRSYFAQITATLRLNPDGTPVSKKPSYGWGGAMGPAQMLPSVWLNYAPQIAAITGHNPPSPWNIQDAFVAVALKLRDDGATARTYNAEWKAAMIYFAGKNWNKPSYRFYGDSIMDLADDFQKQIDMILAAN